MTITDLTHGRWPDLLAELGGLTADQLTDRHQPCPCCGGSDRYRFDDRDGSGSWFCNQCGGKDKAGGGGTGMDLLMRVTGWQYAEACQRIEQHLGTIPDPPTKGAEQVWPYGSSFLVCRFPGKKIRPLWWDGSKWLWKAPPAPRPLYRLDALRSRPDAPVLIVEGEKAADAAQRLFPEAVAITWPSGCKAIDKADWTPMAGRRCVLWPDADDVGRQAMAKLAPRLLAAGAAQVRIVHPPADALEGWDLADADWTPQQASAYLKANRTDPITGPTPTPVEVVEPEVLPKAAAATREIQSQPFACLGFDNGKYFYLPQSTGQVTIISRASHTATNLLELAEIGYWESVHPSKEGVNWLSAASRLFREQSAVGVFDPDRIRGRGAWLDDGRVVFHLGDRLIVDGKAHSVHTPPPTRYFYEQARHLDGPSAAPLSDQDAMKLIAIAERFRWEMPVSAQFLLGWLILAPVCGALAWRPHIWVTGGAGTGKTTVLKSFLRPLMGGVLQSATGGTTEAGLRGTLGSDAIPVLFDEFEQNEVKDKQMVQNVLALARIASSEGGKIYKGTTSGGANSFEIRSMFCVSSINVSLIQKADIDRFCVLGLRKDPMDKSEWLDFEREILSVSTIENGKALIARTLGNLPIIVKNAKTLAHALGRKFGQRFGDQHGTLLAGAWSLEANGGCELTIEQAQQWIDQMDWESQQHDAGDADEMKCRDTILQQIVRYGGGLDASLGEMVGKVAKQQSLSKTPWPELVPILGRYGIKVFRGGERLPDGDYADSCQLAFANSNAQLDQLLRATPWSNGAHRSSLRRIAGASAPKAPTHFAGVGSKRCTLVPLSDDDLAIS